MSGKSAGLNEGRTQQQAQPRSDLAALEVASFEQRLDSAVVTLVEEWAAAVPALDRDVRAIAARIARIDDRLRNRTAVVLKQSKLSDFEFRLLAGLLRSGPPYRRAPSDLAGRYVPVTSGGLTGLANRLEKRGLICRVSHPRDQRSLLIELTDAGRDLALETMQAFAEVEHALMARLTPDDLAQGNAFLQKLLHSIEDDLAR